MSSICPGSMRLWPAAAALVVLCLFPAGTPAQPAYPSSNQTHVLSWQRVQELSVRLDELAARARDEAEIDAHHHGSDELAERMNDFAKHAHELRLYTSERDVSSSKVNDQIRKLMDDARNVQ